MTSRQCSESRNDRWCAYDAKSHRVTPFDLRNHRSSLWLLRSENEKAREPPLREDRGLDLFNTRGFPPIIRPFVVVCQ